MGDHISEYSENKVNERAPSLCYAKGYYRNEYDGLVEIRYKYMIHEVHYAWLWLSPRSGAGIALKDAKKEVNTHYFDPFTGQLLSNNKYEALEKIAKKRRQAEERLLAEERFQAEEIRRAEERFQAEEIRRAEEKREREVEEAAMREREMRQREAVEAAKKEEERLQREAEEAACREVALQAGARLEAEVTAWREATGRLTTRLEANRLVAEEATRQEKERRKREAEEAAIREEGRRQREAEETALWEIALQAASRLEAVVAAWRAAAGQVTDGSEAKNWEAEEDAEIEGLRKEGDQKVKHCSEGQNLIVEQYEEPVSIHDQLPISDPNNPKGPSKSNIAQIIHAGNINYDTGVEEVKTAINSRIQSDYQSALTHYKIALKHVRSTSEEIEKSPKQEFKCQAKLTQVQETLREIEGTIKQVENEIDR